MNRIRDTFLDFQARKGISAQGQHKALSAPLSNAEVVFNDPSDDGMSALLGKFWAAWHDLTNEPESSPTRTALIHATTTFTTRLQVAHQQLTQQRADLNVTVQGIGEEINSKATEIAGLNLQIKQVELNGDMANDLRDRRDLLLDQLSSLGNISYSEDETGSMSVYLGTHELVFGTAARKVNVVDDLTNPGMVKLQFAIDSDDVQVHSGQLRGVLDARDVALPELIARLNNFVTGLMNTVNSIHQQGYGLNDATALSFFTGTDASNIAVNSVLQAAPNPSRPPPAQASRQPSNALAIANLEQATNMLAGLTGGNLLVNEALSAGNIATGITVGAASSRAPTTWSRGPNVELRYGSATAPLGTAPSPRSTRQAAHRLHERRQHRRQHFRWRGRRL